MKGSVRVSVPIKKMVNFANSIKIWMSNVVNQLKKSYLSIQHLFDETA